MSRCIECLKNSSAKVESLTVFDVVDRAFVIAEHAFVFGVHPKLVKTACRSDMVSMAMSEEKTYRLLCNSLDNPVKLRNISAGIEQDSLVLSFDKV